MLGEILGAERRRRWSDDEKLAIVRSVGVGGATVTQIAQRYDVTRQQIYRWRYELKGKGLLPPDPETAFLPVEFLEMSAEALKSCSASASRDSGVEVVLRNGRSLRVNAHLNASALTQLIKTVETA